MARRFIDTEIFKDEWFVELPTKYKLLWIYLMTNCDNAGVIKVSFKVMEFYIGDKLDPNEIKELLKGKIIEIDKGRKWFIPNFLKFQYPKGLNSNKPAIVSVRQTILKNNLTGIVKELFGNNYLMINESLGNEGETIKDQYKDKDHINSLNINNINNNNQQNNTNGGEQKKSPSPARNPTLKEVIDYAESQLYERKEAEKFYNYYEAQGWLTSSGMPITNWHNKLTSWMLNRGSFDNGNGNKKNSKKDFVPSREDFERRIKDLQEKFGDD